MKNNFSTLNLSIILIGSILVAVLSWMGCNTSSKEVSKHEGHTAPHEQKAEKPRIQVSDASLPINADLDSVVVAALSSIKTGKESGDMGMVMNEGIMKLRAVLERDENHEQATYQMALLSLESGQLEKAEKRFEKLILLQPENQEYKKMLEETRNKLAK